MKTFGGRDRVRTCDPLVANQVLSQLSYTPTAVIIVGQSCRTVKQAKRIPSFRGRVLRGAFPAKEP